MSALPDTELWSDETVAEFHLNNAMDEQSYRQAINQVLEMGVDPTQLNPDHLDHSEVWQRLELYLPDRAEKHRL